MRRKIAQMRAFLGRVSTSSERWQRFCSLLCGLCSPGPLLSGGPPATSTIFPTTSTPTSTTISMFWKWRREKVVKHMWDVYTNSRRGRLPRFWQEAFEAAYEDLANDDPDVRVDFFHAKSGANHMVSGLFFGKTLIYSDPYHIILQILLKYASEAKHTRAKLTAPEPTQTKAGSPAPTTTIKI